jgi:lysophospholipase L1-like esterase
MQVKGNIDYSSISGAVLTTDSMLETLELNWPIAAWGDSLTFGTGPATVTGGYVTDLIELYERKVYNGGMPSQTSSAIRAAMVADTAKYPYSLIIWVGRNNIAQQATIISDIDAMIAAAGHNRYIVLSVTNMRSEISGSANYNTIAAINAALASTYGVHYVDVRTELVNSFNPGLPQDVTDNGNDVPPNSLMADDVHMNDAGYQIIADYIVDNYSDILLETSYTNKLINANKVVGLLKGDLQDINVGEYGTFTIGGEPIAYIPGKELVSGSSFYGNGGRLITTAAVLNIAVGNNALLSLTSGNGNVAVGAGALQLTTTGSQSTVIGRFAAFNNTSGSLTAVGYNAALGNTIGTGNVAIGNQALPANQAGNSNVAVGTVALFTMNGGGNNVAIGHGALQLLSGTTSNDTAVGFEALRNLSTGTRNTSVGALSGRFNTTGNDNIFAGYFSGWGNGSSGAVANNVAVGSNTMRLIVAGADGNIVIGANSVNTNSLSGDNNIVVGTSIELPTTSGSNQLSIGNLIFATGGFGTNQTIGIGSVGIANNAPVALLTLGTAGSRAGTISLAGSTSGTITIQSAADAGTYTLTLPTDDGTAANQAFVTNGSGATSWGPVLDSGTWTPTITGVLNVDSTTVSEGQYMRVGNVVTASFHVNINATTETLGTTARFTLPIASNFTLASQLAGGGGMPNPNNGVAAFADATNNEGVIYMNAATDSGFDVYVSFTYQIL